VTFDRRHIDIRRKAAQPLRGDLETGAQKVLLATEHHDPDVQKFAALHARHHAHDRVAIPHGG
jgi:hypothetical protein